MKAAVFSDLHGHQWSEFSSIVDYRGEAMNSRLADAVKVLDAIATYVEKHNITYGIFAGDLFHRKRLIDVPVFNAIAGGVHRLSRLLKAIYVLAGNHDLVRRSSAGEFSTEHALVALGRYRNVHIIDQPSVVLDGIGLVPYADDLETAKRGLEAVSHSRCILMHAGVSGARTGAVEYQPLEPLTVDDLPRVPIYSGHYHYPQEVGHLTYIGAPLEFVRNDGYAKRRGFMVLDLNKPKEYERIRIRGPRFVTLSASKREMSNDDVRGNFVDLMLDDESQKAEDLVSMLMDHGARAVNVIPVVQQKSAVTRLKVKAKKGKLPSLPELCDGYVDRLQSSELDAALLKRIAQEALQEAEARSEA